MQLNERAEKEQRSKKKKSAWKKKQNENRIKWRENCEYIAFKWLINGYKVKCSEVWRKNKMIS